jgi:hypothetical protein
MSRCIDLFVDAPLELDKFAETLGELTGLSFIGDTEGSRWILRQDDAVAELVVHDFVDDRHLLLSRYRYDLLARVDGPSLLESPEARLLRRVLSAIKADGQYAAVLVFDLQHTVDSAEGPAIRRVVP